MKFIERVRSVCTKDKETIRETVMVATFESIEEAIDLMGEDHILFLLNTQYMTNQLNSSRQQRMNKMRRKH